MGKGKIASVVKVEGEVDEEPHTGRGDGGRDEELPYERPMRPICWVEWTCEPQALILTSEKEDHMTLYSLILVYLLWHLT